MTTFMRNRACCENGSTDTNPPKDCLDKWKLEKREVCNEYDEILALTNRYNDIYTNSNFWEAKVKGWQELVETTDKKAGEVVDSLSFLHDQLKVLCQQSDRAVSGMEKITCLVKRIFDAFYTYDEEEKGLKDKIIAFKKEVECTKPGDEEKAEVIKCIEAYEAKIILVCELQNNILKKLVETLKYIVQLDSFFCDESSGLKIKIVTLIDDFEQGLSEEHQCGSSGNRRQEESAKSSDFPCNPDEVKPKPKFRIGRDNTYYHELKEAYQAAVVKTKASKAKWMEYKTKSDKKLSQKASLTEAIRAAEVAESGK